VAEAVLLIMFASSAADNHSVDRALPRLKAKISDSRVTRPRDPRTDGSGHPACERLAEFSMKTSTGAEPR
jgi:hypothetical protein